MVVIFLLLLLIVAIAFNVYQWHEQGEADERVAHLLRVNAGLEAEGRDLRGTNHQLRREVADHLSSLELVLRHS